MEPYQFDQSFLSPPHLPPHVELPGLKFSSIEQSSPLVLAGVDEVGRGPLAGPVVVGAVILPLDPKIEGLSDSKNLTPEQREALFIEIHEVALAVSVSIIDAQIIDKINILQATLLGMRKAIQELSLKPHLVIVDGNQRPGSGLKEIPLVKGDQKSAAIMAASIVAKVTRDQIMEEASKLYPQYGFIHNKGYGSADHLRALTEMGPSPIHRKTFAPVARVLRQEVELI